MSDTNPAPTPRTDAMQASGKAHYMSLDLARTLERELAAKDEAIAQLLRSSAHLAIDRDQLRARVAELEAQLKDASMRGMKVALDGYTKDLADVKAEHDRIMSDMSRRVTELETDLREDRHLAKLADENLVLMKRIAELEKDVFCRPPCSENDYEGFKWRDAYEEAEKILGPFLCKKNDVVFISKAPTPSQPSQP